MSALGSNGQIHLMQFGYAVDISVAALGSNRFVYDMSTACLRQIC